MVLGVLYEVFAVSWAWAQRVRRWWSRGRPSLPMISDEVWARQIEAIPILHGLNQNEQSHLIQLAQQFIRSKVITPIGVRPTSAQLAWMALQACLPILYLGLDWYRNFYEIILLPRAVERVEPIMLADGVMGTDHSLHQGEAWVQGPVVLVWPEVLHDGQWDGYHLLIHELVHKLDMLAGGVANGMPPAQRQVPIERWQSTLERAYRLWLAQEASGESLGLLDEQAAEGLDEFLAIVCEQFFTQPQPLRYAYPELYQLLQAWFHQDPAVRQGRGRMMRPD